MTVADARDGGAGKGVSGARLHLGAIAFLTLTAALSLAASYYHLFMGDDFLELWCDEVSSIGRLVHIEKTVPLAVDPFFFHGLTFVGIHLFGVTPMFLRLPSLGGFLLMQVCLYYFVRRIASERAAVLALAFPAITGVLVYTLFLRPYGLLLGLFGVAMLSWQTAARRETHRGWALGTLALSLALMINTQYYAVLLLLPLGAAEAVRWWQNRRVDAAMLLSMGAGMAGTIFILPFLKGGAEFRSHYQAKAIPYEVVSQSYLYILTGRSQFGGKMQHLLVVGFGVLAVLVLWACVREMRSKALLLSDAEFVFLIGLAALPFFGFLLGHFVTDAMEPRYVLGSVIGIAVLLSIALAPLLRGPRVGRAALLLLFAAIAWKGVVDACAERTYRQDLIAGLVLSPEIKAKVMATPSRVLYTQDIDLFASLSYYAQDRDMVSHLALVYSADEEMRWKHIDTSSLIALHLKSFTPLPVLPYESLTAQPGEHLFAITHGGWNWADQALAAEPAEAKHEGLIFGGCELVAVRFQ